jgi:hypothetical protein
LLRASTYHPIYACLKGTTAGNFSGTPRIRAELNAQNVTLLDGIVSSANKCINATYRDMVMNYCTVAGRATVGEQFGGFRYLFRMLRAESLFIVDSEFWYRKTALLMVTCDSRNFGQF